MSRYRFGNNCSALVTATVTAIATTITLEAGGGGKFPTLTGGDMFRGTLIAASGVSEIVNVLSIAGDVLTVQRGQEGTPALTFPAGSRFELRMTAGMAGNFLQRSGDSMNGDLDMARHSILNPKFPAPVEFVHINAQLIRPIDIDPATPYDPNAEMSSIVIPPHATGQRPSYHGRVILNAGMVAGIIFDWFGNINALPAHLKLCDGTNGTPDLRGQFTRGLSPGIDGIGSYGGAFEYYNDPDGAHNHHSPTNPTSLGVTNLPPPVIGQDKVSVESGGDVTVVENIPGTSYNTTVAHSHTIKDQEAHRHKVQSLPPYMVVAKVMFNI